MTRVQVDGATVKSMQQNKKRGLFRRKQLAPSAWHKRGKYQCLVQTCLRNSLQWTQNSAGIIIVLHYVWVVYACSTAASLVAKWYCLYMVHHLVVTPGSADPKPRSLHEGYWLLNYFQEYSGPLLGDKALMHLLAQTLQRHVLTKPSSGWSVSSRISHCNPPRGKIPEARSATSPNLRLRFLIIHFCFYSKVKHTSWTIASKTRTPDG